MSKWLISNRLNSTPSSMGGGCSSKLQGGTAGPRLEGSGFLSLLSFQLAIYMASVWWMQMLLWWKPRSGRQFLPSTSAWEAWTGCPSECHRVGSPGTCSHLERTLVELALVVQRLSCYASIWKGKLGVRVTGTSPWAEKLMSVAFMVRATYTMASRPAY